jgi:recombination protein RecT
MQQQNQQLTRAQQDARDNANRLKTLAGFIEARKDKISKVMAAGMDIERVTKIAIAAASRNPTLLKSTPESIYASIHTSVQLGLEPGSPLGEGYLVPYWNSKTSRYECQFIPGYQGLITLARRSGVVTKLYARAVYKKEVELKQFHVELGLHEDIRHTPYYGEDRGDWVLVYAVAHIKDADPQFIVMTRADIERRKSLSKSRDKNGKLVGPWVDHEEAMALKTSIRELFKYIPKSVDKPEMARLARAIDIQGKAEAGADTHADDLAIDTTADAAEEDAPPHDPVTGEVKEQAAALPEQAGGAVATPAQPSMAERMRGELRAPAEPANEKRATAPAKQVDAGLEASIFDEISDAETAEQLQKAVKRLRDNESALTSYQFGKLFERAQKVAKRLGVTL